MPNSLAPRLSIVIPALNESATIGDCLASITAQDYPHEVEVIVVDNGSTDDTAEIARRYGATVISEPRRGVCHARHRGTRSARGDIVVSSDADTTFAPDWLTRIDDAFTSAPERVATCGPCRFVDGPWWSTPYTATLFGITSALYRLTGYVAYATATNIAFRRSACSGYDTTATQGGDELGLLRSLRTQGRIHFDAARVTNTSSRRLRRGLIYNAVVTCLFFYLFAYNVNRLAGRTIVGSAPMIRPDGIAGQSPGAASALRWRITAVATLMVLAATWWLTPIDVV